MLLKWTQDEDLELSRIIRRHGTSDWALIRKHFKSHRSRDSVIKRWHGKLKFERPQLDPPEKSKKIVIQRRKEPPPKRNRGSRKSNPGVTRRDHRPPATAPNNSRNRFQRLRNFLEGTRGEREKRVEEAEEEEQVAKDMSEEELEEDGFAWGKGDDDRLLSLVLHEGLTNWSRLGSEVGCTQAQARMRWQEAIYNSIKLDDKVGGFHKYSNEEDSILSLGYRNGLSWAEIMAFLPGRTEFSIEARWRRLLRPQLQVQLSKNKHYIYRQFLKKIVQKRRGERHPLDDSILQDLQPSKTA